MQDSLRDVHQQLHGLRQQCAAGNPELYRDLALYLQVLRDGLLNTVQQACFYLATDVHPDRYQAMEDHARQQLHRRLRALVRRACSLLTVEQLADLAAQQAREQRAERRHRRQQWLEGLSTDSQVSTAGASEPPGSVALGLQPPIELVAGDSPLMARLMDGGGRTSADHAPSDQPTADQQDPQQPERDPNDEHPAPGDSLPATVLEAFQVVMERLGQEPDSSGDAGDADQVGAPPPWNQGQLPREPGALLVWLDGFEEALGRRLRNLSHAINVELLRSGLSRSLLPLSLLEAATQGRLELQQAPPNLIRVPVAGIEPVAVLLRPTDLEQVLPALRTCRSRWRQQRQEVRRMAELSRRLQRRVQVLEAEQLWLQDIAAPLS